MTKYVIGSGTVSTVSDSMIALPLFIITLFCFGLLLINAKPINSQLVAASTANQVKPSGTTLPTQLPALSIAPNDQLPLITTAPTSQASSTPSPITTSPQQSTALVNNLQAAIPNKITVQSFQPHSKNLSRHQRKDN